jgi:predicted acetyltransferase
MLGPVGAVNGELRLRPLRSSDEREFHAAHEAMMPDDFDFGFGVTAGMSWADYLTDIEDERLGRGLLGDEVAATFLVAQADGRIVGRSSIRHALNARLLRIGGHIGYCVLPTYRRRGYAREILRQSLVIVRSLGVDRVLVTCDDDNIASIRVIESCGGRLESIEPQLRRQALKRRYWID